ncbi:MAG: Type 1 glutamine amidotransferase-like domain-containing protein [Cruoricaptor ignavus]|nr:Type 1 glutamine amidotransferase-like domain-containing protein [Cruoricaptor ignavus]
MKNLFLTSSFCDVSEYLQNFYGESLRGKTVTFIPTASQVEEYKGYVEDDKTAFTELGIIIDELNIEKETVSYISQKIVENDFMYVSGGNTFYLLQELKKSGADKFIIEQINLGKLYIGASAGSIILSKNIEYVQNMDDKDKAPMLEDYSGLGIVGFYPLPHHGNEPFAESVENIINEYGSKINLVPISNTQVIEVKNDQYEIKGK